MKITIKDNNKLIMGSNLHINELPYSSDKEVYCFNDISMQFSTGIEIILSLDELEILLKAKFLYKHLDHREILECLIIAQKTIESENLLSEEGEDIDEQLKYISRKLGYYASRFDPQAQLNSESIFILKKAAIQVNLGSWKDSLKQIKSIMDRVRPHFIEGKHYIYTI